MLKKYSAKAFCIILAICLAASAFAPAALADGAARTQSAAGLIIPKDALTINSIVELNALAERCRLDSWSVGRSVVLMCDVDVSNSDFVPIPSFGGSFYGNGHTISGLSVKGGYSPAGLFLELQEGALVRDLTVTGSVVPAGKSSLTGGIVGKNGGTVLNCLFSGTVNGYNETGGIAGCNLTSGVVSLCRVEGSVTGMNMTGGIAGRNEGTIIGCECLGRVNNVSTDPSVSLDDLNLSFDMTSLSSIGRNENVPMDTGGIAGYSVNSIIGCNSLGITGYPHVGYNVGGIAGRNCGFISGCTSSGSVYGRKDIGGITGQGEPWRQEVVSESDISILQGQITAMQATVNQLQADASNAGSAVSDELVQLQTMLNNVFESMHNITTSVHVNVPDINALLNQYYPEDGSGSTGIGDIIAGGGDISSVVGSLDRENAQNAAEMMGEFASGIYASGSTDLSGVRESVALFAEGVGEINSSYTGHSTEITADLDLLTSQVTEINDTVNRILFNDGSGTKITDVSLVNPDLALLGKIGKCTNYAAVEGDYNVGGIVGTQANESSIDPEDDLTVKIDNAISKEYNLVVICADCVNYGTIRAKMDYCGGIAGRIGLGAIIRCRGYGIISSSSGDYVGGIAGQNSASVKNCYAKAVLSGENYIGGITGYTTDKNTDGGSGEVAGSVAMVNIIAGQKYCGAVTGAESGEIHENLFVSDTLCGYNHVSKRGEAEPASYAQILKRKGLPEEFLSMQVYFICDGTLVSSLSAPYGECPAPQDIPAVPAKEGQYGEWLLDPGEKLVCDTVAEAQYTPYVKTLSSSALRDDGRHSFYVQGVFAPDAVFSAQRVGGSVTLRELPFRINVTEYGREIIEQWQLSVPGDGSGEHTLHYRTPNGSTGHISIFVKTPEGWHLCKTEAQGSYILFTVPGGESEIAVVSSASVAWIVIIGVITAVLLLIILIYFALAVRSRAQKRREARKNRNNPDNPVPENGQEEETPRHAKKKRGKAAAVFAKAAVIIPLTLIILCFAAAMLSPKLLSGLMGSYYISRLGMMNGREMLLTAEGRRGGEDFSLEAEIYTQRMPGGEKISRISTGGINLYYSGGNVFLENGKAYSVKESTAEYLDVVGTAVSVFKGADTTLTRDGGYTVISASSGGEGAREILGLVLPQLSENLGALSGVDVSMYVLNNRISYFTFTGGVHTATDSILSFEAKLQIVYNGSGGAIPEAVSTALSQVRAGEKPAGLNFSADTLSLLSAWGGFMRKDPQAAAVSVKASSTLLSVSADFDWLRKNVNGTDINCITVGTSSYYMAGSKMCSANGGSIGFEQAESLSAVNMLDTAFTLSQSLIPEVSEQNGAKLYTMRLSGAELNGLAQTLVPQLADRDISLSAGSLYITVKDGSIASVLFNISGEISLPVSIPVTVSASASINSFVSEADCEIPLAVVSALAG